MTEFEKELRGVINRFSQENESNTPDWILAGYVGNCLDAFNGAVKARDQWYGVNLRPGISSEEIVNDHRTRP
jgi:hypothetical protein